MRYLICGDRNWSDYEAVWAVVESLPDDSVVIEGAARGADSMAALAASERGLTLDIYPADWDRHGRAAGPVRNMQMLNSGKPDVVIWFHNNLAASKGTRHMVNAARAAGIPTYSYREWLER